MTSDPNSRPLLSWYCIRTKPGQEKLVAAAMRRLRPDSDGAKIDILLPELPDGKYIFPGYIFASFDLKLWRFVNSRPGVVGIVRAGLQPITVERFGNVSA